jgi:hypothetical protein
MSNILQALAPTLFSAANQVAAEPFGVINAMRTDFSDKGVAVNIDAQSGTTSPVVKVPVAPTRTESDWSPAMTTTAGTDGTATTVDVSIDYSKHVSWNFTGEELRVLENGDNRNEYVSQLIMEGMRGLRNPAEVRAAAAIKIGASRAYGTAGTTPFASDLSALTNARKILQDNGAPLTDLQFVGNTACGLNLRNLGIIQNAYQAGSEQERRTGTLERQFGFQINESAGVAVHTIGTGASYLANGAVAVGGTDITVDTGSGTIVQGDVLTYAADSTNKYVVGTALASNVVKINKPGARIAIPDNNAITVGAAYTANLAFERSAVVAVFRPPIIPVGNGSMTQRLITDKFGMTYLLVQIVGDGMITWRLHICYGFKVINPQFVALVLG